MTDHLIISGGLQLSKRGNSLLMGNILVIEDDNTVRKNIKQLLEIVGYKVLTAENGGKGIKIALEKQPDFIICDIMMPGLDGYEVFRQLSCNKKTSAIPFIFLTARAEMSDLRQGMNLGADDYLLKPFKATELLEVIRTRLEKREKIILGHGESRGLKNKETELNNNSIIVVGNPPEVIKVSEIVYISSSGGYTNVFTVKGKKVLVRRLLKNWEKLLPNDQFLRIHHSTIINIEFVQRVEKWFNNALRIRMQNVDEPLEVSRRVVSTVKLRLKMKG